MTILCTVLHICNTAPPLLVYNITWIQNCSFVMFCTRVEKKRKNPNLKKEKRTNCNWCENEVWASYHRNACDHVHGAEPAVWSIYCAVFTVSFLLFKYTVHLHRVPCWSECLARILKNNFFFFFTLWTWQRGFPCLFVFVSVYVPTCHLIQIKAQQCYRRRCDFVCCRHQFVIGWICFHKALPHYSWDE